MNTTKIQGHYQAQYDFEMQLDAAQEPCTRCKEGCEGESWEGLCFNCRWL